MACINKKGPAEAEPLCRHGLGLTQVLTRVLEHTHPSTIFAPVVWVP